MTWYAMCPPGRSLTTRQLLQEAKLSANDLKNLSKKDSNGKYYDPVAGPLLAAMHIGWDLYMKPTEDPEQPVTD